MLKRCLTAIALLITSQAAALSQQNYYVAQNILGGMYYLDEMCDVDIDLGVVGIQLAKYLESQGEDIYNVDFAQLMTDSVGEAKYLKLSYPDGEICDQLKGLAGMAN